MKMKVKINKSMLAGIFLIIITVGSTLAYAVLRTIQGAATEVEEVTLPSQRIIDYKLSDEQKRLAIRNGITVLNFEYSPTDSNQQIDKALVESAANEFSNQVILEEISNTGMTQSRLILESFYGKQVLRAPTNEDLFDSLCDILTNPPVACATRNV